MRCEMDGIVDNTTSNKDAATKVLKDLLEETEKGARELATQLKEKSTRKRSRTEDQPGPSTKILNLDLQDPDQMQQAFSAFLKDAQVTQTLKLIHQPLTPQTRATKSPGYPKRGGRASGHGRR